MKETVKKSLQLTDGTVQLRPYRNSDVYHVYDAVVESYSELTPWMYWCHPEYNIKETRDWVASRAEDWERGTEYSFAITDTKKGGFLGGCSIYVHHQFRFAELGYWVRTSRTGQGLATAAVNLLVQFGFDELKLNRIEIVVATGNEASQRVAEKAGATREGVLRNRLLVPDKVYDAVMFSLVPKDINPGD